jgi:hypothetical protein
MAATPTAPDMIQIEFFMALCSPINSHHLPPSGKVFSQGVHQRNCRALDEHIFDDPHNKMLIPICKSDSLLVECLKTQIHRAKG